MKKFWFVVVVFLLLPAYLTCGFKFSSKKFLFASRIHTRKMKGFALNLVQTNLSISLVWHGNFASCVFLYSSKESSRWTELLCMGEKRRYYKQKWTMKWKSEYIFFLMKFHMRHITDSTQQRKKHHTFTPTDNGIMMLTQLMMNFCIGHFYTQTCTYSQNIVTLTFCHSEFIAKIFYIFCSCFFWILYMLNIDEDVHSPKFHRNVSKIWKLSIGQCNSATKNFSLFPFENFRCAFFSHFVRVFFFLPLFYHEECNFLFSLVPIRWRNGH